MIMQPDLINAPLVEEAIAAVKHKINPSALAQVSFASYDEGRCAQILHKGPFAHEGPTVERVHAFIAFIGRRLTKKHHELYLTDFRCAAPQNWKVLWRRLRRTTCFRPKALIR